MADKALTESGLKALLTKHKIKDNGLQKALAAYDKLDDNAHDECLKGIAHVSKLAEALRKSKEVKGNDDVADYLDEVIDAASSEEKDLEKEKAAAAKADAAAQKKAQKKEEEEEEEDEDDDEEEDDEEEEGDYGERLLTAFKKLKTLNGKPLTFIVCDARPLPAIMVAKRISTKHKDELSEITGGSRKFSKKGSCYFAKDHYVLELPQAMPGLARKVQKAVKNHTGKKFKFSHGGETAGDEDEESENTPEQAEEQGGEGQSPEAQARKQGTARGGVGATPEQGQGAPKGKGNEKPEQEEEESEDDNEQEELEDRRRNFKKARAAWVRVKMQAEADLEKVKDGARMHYLADADQFPKVVKGCKDIDTILDNLDDELRDTLDEYAKTPVSNRAKLKTLSETASEVLDKYQKYVASDPILKAIDQKEFADVTVHAPITKALADLRRALA
jgi:hypothetical protein